MKSLMKRQMKSATLILATFSVLFVILAAGCGGGGGSNGGTNNGGTNNGTNSGGSPQTYTEAVTLPTGQSGSLNLGVQANNTAAGTLTVVAVSASARPRLAAKPHALTAIAPGTYAVSGTVTGGTFTLTGTVSGTAFTLTGSLPSGSSTASFTLTLGSGAGAVVYPGTLATSVGTANIPYAGTYTVSYQGSGPTSGSFSGTATLIISPTGTVTVANNSSGDNGTDTASLNSSGQIVIISPNSSKNADIDTLTGTVSGSQGSYTISGTTANTNGDTGTFTATESSTATTSQFAGSYQGVYLNTSGQYSPDAGTIAFAVNSSGAVSGSSFDFTGDSSNNPYTGSASSTGALVLNGGANQISGTLSQNSTTHVLSASYTESNGTKGMLMIGLAPTASPLAGSYSGTATSSSGQFPMTLTISSTGAVNGTIGNPAVANQGFNFGGYVDASGNLYTAETSGGTPEIIVAGLALNGTSLTGTGQSSSSDGGGTTTTLSLTKQ